MHSDFNAIREEYNRARNIERQKIVNKLKSRDFKASGHQGTWNYTSRGQIKPGYNLGIWKWIVAQKGDVTAVISLQTLEQDSKTKNIHVLFDRISIDVFKDSDQNILSEISDSYFQSIKSRYNVENEYDSEFVKQIITDFELPLGEDELTKIVEMIENKIAKIN